MRWIYSVFVIFAIFSLSAEESISSQSQCLTPEDFKEKFVETEHRLTVQGQELSYRAIAGNLILRDSDDKAKASVFFTSYLKKDGEKASRRPITFCFNGGPGSCSVWLNLGGFGPMRVVTNEKGVIDPPYRYEENPYTLLDFTDLVFIDPVSTGYSCAAPGEDPKQFYGVEEDVRTVADFIRLFTTRYGRWDSPKFIAGESYGTTRAAAVAKALHDDYYFYLNGLVLISSALNFQALRFDEGNDLPYLLVLPSYTAVAWAHGKLKEPLQSNVHRAIEEAKEFALGTYATALLKGDLLTQIDREEIADRLAYFTGLSSAFIQRNKLRVPTTRFAKELLREDSEVIGLFDGRVVGMDPDSATEFFSFDPSRDFVIGAFASSFQTYLEKDLLWKDDRVYRILADVWPWDVGKAKNRYLNVSSALQQVIVRNPHLRVFVASGLFDLATPFFSSAYALDHLGLSQSFRGHIEHRVYPGGHMMYLQRPNLENLSRDLRAYYARAVISGVGRQKW